MRGGRRVEVGGINILHSLADVVKKQLKQMTGDAPSVSHSELAFSLQSRLKNE